LHRIGNSAIITSAENLQSQADNQARREGCHPVWVHIGSGEEDKMGKDCGKDTEERSDEMKISFYFDVNIPLGVSVDRTI